MAGTWPEPFRAVLAGNKHHEIRVNDRGFAVGDVLVLNEWDPWRRAPYARDLGGGRYTGRSVRVRVTYMTPGGEWGLPAGMCVMSIEPMEPARKPCICHARMAGECMCGAWDA